MLKRFLKMCPRSLFNLAIKLALGVSFLTISPQGSPSWLAAQDPSDSGSEGNQSRAQEADHWNREGLRLFREGRYTQAAEAFEKVYRLFPNIPDVVYNLGLAYQRVGKFEESIPPLEKSVTLRPEDTAVRRALGVSLLRVNRLREAADQLEKSLHSDRNSVDGLYFLAMAYYLLKEPDRAEECLRWMSERNPDSALLHLRTGNALRVNRRYQDALAELKKAVALDPELLDVHLELGLTYIGLKDGVPAQAAFAEEIRRHPGSAEAHLTLGELYLVVKRDYPRAIEKIRQAEELGIEAIRVEFDLGDAYMRLGQLGEAQQHLEQAVKLDPMHRRAQYLLARVYQRQGKKAQAQKRFKIAQSLAKQELGDLKRSFRAMVEAAEDSEKTR